MYVCCLIGMGINIANRYEMEYIYDNLELDSNGISLR